MKRCCCCRRALPTNDFYPMGPDKLSSRCRRCHGVAVRRCRVCHRLFIGKSGRKACSTLCSQMMRAPTFLLCRHCGQVFGPVDHLKRRLCSKACANAAAATGRLTIRKTCRKARSAHSLLHYHVQAGNIVRPNKCEECGATDRRIEGAHFDYDEPLRVRWLCRSCHVRWDKREPKHGTVIVAGPGHKRKPTPEKTPGEVTEVGGGDDLMLRNVAISAITHVPHAGREDRALRQTGQPFTANAPGYHPRELAWQLSATNPPALGTSWPVGGSRGSQQATICTATAFKLGSK